MPQLWCVKQTDGANCLVYGQALVLRWGRMFYEWGQAIRPGYALCVYDYDDDGERTESGHRIYEVSFVESVRPTTREEWEALLLEE